MQTVNVKYGPSVTVLEQLYRDRRERVKRVCSTRPELGATQSERTKRASNNSEQKPVIYCGIPKLASTFWKKVLPHVRKPNRGPSEMINPTYEKGSLPFTFMFVRNPYQRAISGYIDKLFGPNTMFWNMIGKYIIKRYRVNATERSLRCGHDVTFPEFLEYVVGAANERYKMNGHFSPMHMSCNPCRVHYDVIGNFDTFLQDTDFVLESILNKTGVDLFDMAGVDTTETTRISNKIRLTFRLKMKIIKCMTFQEALERVWINFQVRGLLGKGIKMPLSVEQSENFTADQVIDVFLDARQKSESWQRKTNKEEAFVEMFHQVPLETLEKYIESYSPDFELFGFEKRPETIFDRTAVLNTTYNYLSIYHRTKDSDLPLR